jgi:hypothetical protein
MLGQNYSNPCVYFLGYIRRRSSAADSCRLHLTVYHSNQNRNSEAIMSLFSEPPKPKSLLDFHRILSPTAGVRVSPLCLGAMNFGNAWESGMGKCDKETSFAILDFFYEQGGNFVDT